MCTTDTSERPARRAADVTVEMLDVGEDIRVCLRDRRADIQSLFSDLAPADREAPAADAWQIGVRALRNAYAQARESWFEDVGKALVDDVERGLRTHLDRQFADIESVLKRYFDDADGEVGKRLTAFLADEGVLHRLLKEHVGGERSVLAETLAHHVGANSELLRRLSPSDKEGVVQVIEERVRTVLDDNHRALMNALDPLAENGAVAKLLRTLRDDLEKAQAHGGRQLEKAVAALDANDEGSAISRLMRETRTAQRTLVAALNPDEPTSPLSAIRSTVETLLEAHGQSQRKLLEEQQKNQRELESYIRETVARMESRKEAASKSPRGGTTFEEDVVEFLTRTCGDTYLVEPTGNTTGQRRHCKKGDAVVSFTSESAFRDCRVVVEAKRACNYTAAKVLEEMEVARENRDADVGVFVLAPSHAWPGAPEFVRYGSTIFVQWDAEDPSTDPYLRAAMMAALFMSKRRRQDADAGDITALRDVEKRVQDEVTRIAKMRKENDKIASCSKTIRDELRKAERKLELMLDKAKQTLTALSVDLVEEAAEVASPIVLPGSRA